MRTKYFQRKIALAICALSFILSIGWSCKKLSIVSTTTDAVNIVGYLDEHPDSFSLFRQMLSITGYDGFLSVYGHYTLFLPTNNAVKLYLQKEGKTALTDINVDTLKDLVKFHLLQDTVYTISFTDGKLPYLTMYGQYLVTGANYQNGVTHITVNKQANILVPNLREGNGVIHVIDKVLQPATSSLAQLVVNNPKYSIFGQALTETGLYDSLNILPGDNPDTTRAWVTLLAESDSVFQTQGINNYDELKAKYSNTGNPKDVADSLHLFVDYHILYNANYLADIISSSSFNTWAPTQVITTKYTGDSILINDDVFNGVHEQGVELDRAGSDISATNGVLHDAAGLIAIKKRSPFPVYWDVCQYPEIMSLPAYYGKQTYNYTLTNLPSFITDPGPAAPSYVYGGAPFVNGDYLKIPLGANRTPWVELKTPLLVQGKYKVWICYRTAGRDNVDQVSIDGVALQRTINHHTYMPSGTDAEREAQGWKVYTSPDQKNWTGYLVGTIDIQTTSQHALRFTNLQGTDNDFWLDMIEFIPVDMDQQYPRFQTDGTPVYAPVVTP
ncbi:fasciclin domain-containing protein [Arachidicoccus soli]|uniref:Fasciclin domain-containing protein n=1 Tax=Arachidicoccus soli TaxID=2341117 RepID=A0A386HS42_9BACT|nr:fasciclin domain-containing protein [Arachidicoccus soli]AYD48290.1 fasciclin domain-containing protein [Arachidicoccus soli]